jgi:predicted glycosyltransferase
VHQLPPARAADSRFHALVDADGNPVDDVWRAARARELLATVTEFDPDILVIELFPFGRRLMRFELLPLLETLTARPRPPRVACSVRDILVAKTNPDRLREMADTVERFFDPVLVHADPAVVTFDRTFPLTDRIAGRLRYTGYVCEADAPPVDPLLAAARDGVIVSAGGGAAGVALLRTAIAARPLSAAAAMPWRVLVADAVPDTDFAALRDGAGAGITVERARPDFRTLLCAAALSVSQAGYNTMMDIVQTGPRAVVVPFADDQETEQRTRAACFAERGLVTAVDPEGLDAAALTTSLAAAIDRTLAAPPPQRGGIDTGGAAATARILAGLTRPGMGET